MNFIHLATADPLFNSRAAQQADFVSFDPGQDLILYSKQCLEKILSHTDILFTNRHEIERLCWMTGQTRKDMEASQIYVRNTVKGYSKLMLCSVARGVEAWGVLRIDGGRLGLKLVDNVGM